MRDVDESIAAAGGSPGAGRPRIVASRARTREATTSAARSRALPAALLLAVLLTAPAAANDSTAEIRTGGLVLTRTHDVAMLSEDLSISAGDVAVRYVFRNLTPADVTATVAFPVPDIDLSALQLADPAVPLPEEDDFLGFHTSVDGAAVPLSMHRVALARDRDVTAELERAGIPLAGWRAATTAALAALPPARRRDFLRRGILSDATGILAPAWTLRVSYLREQTFPAGRDVVVEHHYRPSVGTSVDTALRRPARDDPDRAGADRTTFCVDDALRARVARLARGRPLAERRIAYVLRTGAGWARPIGDFVLKIDPGGPGVIAATCLAGLAEVAPGRLELRRRDFVPSSDLDILLVGSPDGGK